MVNGQMRLLGAQRSKIRDIFEYGLKRKAEIGEENVFDFSLGNPSVPSPREVNEEILRLVSDCDPIQLHGYTSAVGDASVRESIAEYLTQLHGYPVSKDELYITVGAAAALTSTLRALTNEGDEVILLAPYFPEYTVFVNGAGATVREVGCCYDSFHPDINAIREAINERTAAIIINSPNNPTGAVYTEQELSELAEVLIEAEKKYGRTVYIIADEPYRELLYGDLAVPFIPKIYPSTVVCYSFSKSMSLPGERIGYVFVPEAARDSRDVYYAVAGAARLQGYVCAPSLTQRILPACLGKTADISVYDRNRRLLVDNLREYGYSLTEPEGAFYLWVRSPLADANEFCLAAREKELLLVPSDSFGMGGYVRISYCVDTKMIERALPAFKALAEELGLGDNNEK